jgi:hypothetical protein
MPSGKFMSFDDLENNNSDNKDSKTSGFDAVRNKINNLVTNQGNNTEEIKSQSRTNKNVDGSVFNIKRTEIWIDNERHSTSG